MSEGHQHTVHGENVVLDIGGEVGALVVYTNADLSGQEIEISRTGDGEPRVHTEVHPRRLGPAGVHAAVFASLAAGEYDLWPPGQAGPVSVRIEGGGVAEVDWRDPPGPLSG